jgi:iron(III) transport system substrate-binding protein
MKGLHAVVLVLVPSVLLAMFPLSRSMAQVTPGPIYVTSQQMVERAKQEGKLLLHPALRPEYDSATLPALLKAFGKKYPFIQPGWGVSEMAHRPNLKQALDELTAGKAVVDILGFSGSLPSEYVGSRVLKNFDLKTMAAKGEIKIPPEMIDETGMILWSSNNTGVITYNSNLVAADRAPKSWESCLEAEWKGRFSVDANPNMLTWLVPRWGEEKLFDFARRVKANDPVISRGNTANLGALVEGKLLMNCGMYIHPMSRMLKKAPAAPIKMVVPDPLPITFHDPQAIFAGAKSPHAALLWLEFLASKDAQEVIEANEPGRGSFLVDGNLSNRLAKSADVSICNVSCLLKGNQLAERIAAEIWRLKESRPAER